MSEFVVFVGAGASKPFGIPTMTEMTKNFEEELRKTFLPGITLFNEIHRRLKDYQYFDIESLIVSGFKEFDILREASYRRNTIVHNKGITDKHYCQKILGSQIGVTLSTDFQYIETLLNVIGRFIDHLDNYFSRKMHYKRHPLLNLILNAPPC